MIYMKNLIYLNFHAKTIIYRIKKVSSIVTAFFSPKRHGSKFDDMTGIQNSIH